VWFSLSTLIALSSWLGMLSVAADAEPDTTTRHATSVVATIAMRALMEQLLSRAPQLTLRACFDAVTLEPGYGKTRLHARRGGPLAALRTAEPAA
jgi:hypothetical protein